MPTLGPSVLGAAVSVAVVQGFWTWVGHAVAARWSDPALGDALLTVCGLITISLPVAVLGIRRVPFANYLPALALECLIPGKNLKQNLDKNSQDNEFPVVVISGEGAKAQVVALDAATGVQRWAYQVPRGDQPATRGVSYWPGTKPEIVFGTRSGLLIALDAAPLQTVLRESIILSDHVWEHT